MRASAPASCSAGRYGIAIRSMGACRWIYSPLRSRRGRNSSSDSSPARNRRRLITKFSHALVDHRLVDLVVAIHGAGKYWRGVAKRGKNGSFGSGYSEVMEAVPGGLWRHLARLQIGGSACPGCTTRSSRSGGGSTSKVHRTVHRDRQPAVQRPDHEPGRAPSGRGVHEGHRVRQTAGKQRVHAGGSWSGSRSTTPTFGTTVANLGWEDVRFPKPVFVGDTLRIETTVLAMRGASPARTPGSSRSSIGRLISGMRKWRPVGGWR